MYHPQGESPTQGRKTALFALFWFLMVCSLQQSTQKDQKRPRIWTGSGHKVAKCKQNGNNKTAPPNNAHGVNTFDDVRIFYI